MDDLMREFLTETSESLDTVDNQLVRFEQEPNNAKILDNIFRLVHTIKGTCGFLGLPRLEAIAHAGETLMGKFRDGMPVTSEAVTLILASIDRIKEILAGLEATEVAHLRHQGAQTRTGALGFFEHFALLLGERSPLFLQQHPQIAAHNRDRCAEFVDRQ